MVMKKMKAIPILMAFMAMVCSKDCEALFLIFFLCLKMGRLKTFWLKMTNSSLFEKVFTQSEFTDKKRQN